MASAVLSAFLINDVVCIAFTPLVLHIAEAVERNPRPYLLALATSSNIGSVATVPEDVRPTARAEVEHDREAAGRGPLERRRAAAGHAHTGGAPPQPTSMTRARTAMTLRFIRSYPLRGCAACSLNRLPRQGRRITGAGAYDGLRDVRQCSGRLFAHGRVSASPPHRLAVPGEVDDGGHGRVHLLLTDGRVELVLGDGGVGLLGPALTPCPASAEDAPARGRP